MNRNPIERVAIIGFGEVGGIFGLDLSQRGLKVAITDVILRERRLRAALLEKAQRAGVSAHDSYRDALADAQLVISAVTSSSSVDAATEAAGLLRAGQIYLDINSVSPGKKREISRIIERSNANFVEAAVMAPVSPQRLKVPMLVGGAQATEAAERLCSIGMNAKAASDRIGVASAVKMCRSVLIKGIEALAVECLFAARRFGAEQDVLDSLEATYPSMGWNSELPDYLSSRVAQHGRRRAAEMREVAEALKEVELAPVMALATAARQDWLVNEMAQAGIPFEAENFSWIELADRLRRDSQTHVGVKTKNGDGQR